MIHIAYFSNQTVKADTNLKQLLNFVKLYCQAHRVTVRVETHKSA